MLPVPKIDEKVMLPNLTAIIPYVRGQLRNVLRTRPELNGQFSDCPLHIHMLLESKDQGQTKSNELSSYKPAWQPKQAKMSLEVNGMYEAAGNLTWCDPLPPISGNDQYIAGDPPTWAEIKQAADDLFGEHQVKMSFAASQGKAERIIFPTMLPVHVDSMAQATNASCNFNETLKTVSGHVYVAAWYVAVYDALNAGRWKHRAMLWQAALTVTLHCRVGLDTTQLATLSI